MTAATIQPATPTERATITTAIPVAPTPRTSMGYAVHVDAAVLADVVGLLQALTLTIDPYDHDVDEGTAEKWRLRATTRQFTAHLEEALAASEEDGYGAQCRAELVEIDGMQARIEARRVERESGHAS